MLVLLRRMSSRFPLSLSITLFIMAVLIGHGCIDPEEYKPENPQFPPPGPPQLILPYPDTSFYSGSSQMAVYFDWSTVNGAEIYEVQTDSTLSWSTAMMMRFSNPPTYIQLYRYAVVATYYARIRAGSSSWTNYTEWSEPHKFYLKADL
jgi:hypothetical protein